MRVWKRFFVIGRCIIPTCVYTLLFLRGRVKRRRETRTCPPAPEALVVVHPSGDGHLINWNLPSALYMYIYPYTHTHTHPSSRFRLTFTYHRWHFFIALISDALDFFLVTDHIDSCLFSFLLFLSDKIQTSISEIISSSRVKWLYIYIKKFIKLCPALKSLMCQIGTFNCVIYSVSIPPYKIDTIKTHKPENFPSKNQGQTIRLNLKKK